jgi:hypothetical protein
MNSTNLDKLFEHIIVKNTEEYVAEKFDEYKSGYVWDWEDDFDDIHEAYEEQGRGQAESEILHLVIAAALQALEMPSILPTDEFCELYDKLADHWTLNTN